MGQSGRIERKSKELELEHYKLDRVSINFSMQELHLESFCDDVTEIIRCHTGAGLSEDDCVLLNLPPSNCVPKTLEEKIVAHADNLAKGSREITIEERMMLIAGQSKRSKKNVWRLSMEMELLRD